MEKQRYDYEIVDGTAFSRGTPSRIIEVILRFMHNREKRLRIYYGDSVTGRDWKELHDTEGYIGRSTGQFKIPL